MEQPNTSSGLSHTGNPTSINTTLPASDTMASSSLPSNEKQRGKREIIGFVNDRFPSKVHRSGRQPDTPHDDAGKSHGSDPDSQKHIFLSIFSGNKTKRPEIERISIGARKLDEIIQELNDNPIEAEAYKEQKLPADGQPEWIQRSRHLIAHMMEQRSFHYAIIVLIIIDLVIVFVELVVGELPFIVFFSCKR
jgi:hypothetical protein